MTNPAIITVNREAVRGIIRLGKPAGLFIALSDDAVKFCTGVDSRPGHLCLMKHGPFAEVLDWLMYRGGIMTRGEPVRNRNVSRDPEWRIHVDTDPGIRVSGAQIKPWKGWDEEIRERAPFVVNTERASLIQSQPERPASREESRRAVELASRDEEIIRLVNAGLTFEAIGHEVGLSTSAAHARAEKLRKMGYEMQPPRKRAAREAARERDEEILELAREGMTAQEIAERLGCNLSTAEKAMADARRAGTLARYDRAQKRKIDREGILILLRKGFGPAQIAKQLGISRRSAHRITAELKAEGRFA